MQQVRDYSLVVESGQKDCISVIIVLYFGTTMVIINSSLTYTNILVVSFQWLTIFQQKLWKCITALC